jgi:hypothetical protein
MDEIVKIDVLRYEKSTFRFELIKPENAPLYLSIEQMIDSSISRPENSKLRIRASFLTEIIRTLNSLQHFIPPTDFPKRRLLKDERKEELIRRYYKGMEIDTLAVQFDCAVQEIIQLLVSRNIVVTSNKMNAPKKLKFRIKRRRRY